MKSDRKKAKPAIASRIRRLDPKPAATHSAERRQVAALPYRRTTDGAVEVLLITSRETKRYIVPKGWPMRRLNDPDAAAQEAREEAGVTGKIKRKSIGSYVYWKRLARSFDLLRVEVFPLEVIDQRAEWKEKCARECCWLPPGKAWLLIDEPGLADIVRKFEP
jgi:8-oxo-dGTP pyrophosphatase MutT (NUDIX family)